jgi:hypothetical protein
VAFLLLQVTPADVSPGRQLAILNAMARVVKSAASPMAPKHAAESFEGVHAKGLLLSLLQACVPL